MSNNNKMVPFNGGKMRHIFQPGKGCYEEGFSCEDAQRCWEDPTTIVTLKVHGECCMLVRKPVVVAQQQDSAESAADVSSSPPPSLSYEWIFATRFDSKGKPFPDNHIPIPVVCSDDDERKECKSGGGVQPAVDGKHTYCFIPLEKDKVGGKGSKRSFVGRDTYAAINEGVKNGDIPDPNSDDSCCPEFIAVEWIGRKHQGNIDCLDVDHAIYIHGSTVVADFPPASVRTREQIATLAATEWSIEGVVMYWPTTGERFKLRFDMLAPNDKSLFAQNSKKSPVQPEFTTLKPKVIQAAPPCMP